MSGDQFDVQLEFKERLNYTDYLQKVIENINTALNNEKVSMSKIKMMILNYLNDIPFSWYDPEFENDIKNVIKEKETPNIIKFCGFALSNAYMERHDIPLTKKVNNVDFFKLKNAIVNLLDRRNMLIRKDKIEQSTGINLKYESLDDLIDEMGEDDENEEKGNEET